ncbi:MAG: HAD family phosphatase [Dehalococcoidia bacterium]|nr:HAD family phosphatase [Dehalococcoidia bacterium]
MKYKLIAVDLDGTIVHQDGDISAGDREAIQHALGAGMMVTLATGRMYRPSARFARELGIRIPLICYQGSLIKDAWDGKELWHKLLPLQIAREVIRRIRRANLLPYFYLDDELYLDEVTERVKEYAQRNGVGFSLVDDIIASLKKKPTEIVAIGEPENVARLVLQLEAEFSSSLLVTKSYSTFCEIGHPQSGKGKALEHLARYLGVKQSQTVAIGDGINDIGMLRWAGLGIVIDSNSPRQVIDAADWVVDKEKGDSFPQVMEKLLGM